MRNVRSIQIDFPLEVNAPSGLDRVLSTLVDMICEKYEADNPYRIMWPFGMGSKPNMRAIHTDDHENMFDDSVFHIEVSEKPADAKTLRRRGYILQDKTCPTCGEVLFVPKPFEVSDEGGVVTCANKHLWELGEGYPIPPEEKKGD